MNKLTDLRNSKSNKIIWIISHSCGGDLIGPNKRVFLLGKNLSNDYRVKIFSSKYFHKYLREPENYYRIGSNLEIHYLKNFRYSNFRGQFLNQLFFPISLFFRLLKHFRSTPPDKIILSSPPPFAFIAIYPFLLISKSSLILDIRDLWPEILKSLHKKTLWFRSYMFLVKKTTSFIYKNASHIVSVKKGDLQYIQTNYKTKAKFYFIPNAYTEEKILFDNAYTHKFFSKDNFLISYAGALSSYYTLDELIDVARKCIDSYPEIKFLVAGGGKDLEKYQKKSKLLENIDFIGQQPKNVINTILKNSDVGYLPLKDNPYNRHGISTNKLYDYMYHSLPILGLYNSDYDIVEEFGFGFVEKEYCPESLYQKTLQLYLMEYKKRKNMGNIGKMLLEREYTPNNIAERFKDLLVEE